MWILCAKIRSHVAESGQQRTRGLHSSRFMRARAMQPLNSDRRRRASRRISTRFLTAVGTDDWTTAAPSTGRMACAGADSRLSAAWGCWPPDSRGFWAGALELGSGIASGLVVGKLDFSAEA